AIARDPSRIETLLELARARARLGQTFRALDALERARALQPNRADVVLEMSRLYRSQRMPVRALELARQTMTLGGGGAAPALEVASLLTELGRDNEATEFYEAARRAAPADPSILSALASHYLRRRDFPGATAAIEAALRVNPVDVGILHQAGRT